MINKNYAFFKKNMAVLYAKYGHKFVVIKEEKVIGVYDNEDIALIETLKTEKLGTFIIQELNENEEDNTHHFQYNVYFPNQVM
ncbi:MAG: hypothetical protein ACI352_02750 [Elusimicrobiaceae bacterium]